MARVDRFYLFLKMSKQLRCIDGTGYVEDGRDVCDSDVDSDGDGEGVSSKRRDRVRNSSRKENFAVDKKLGDAGEKASKSLKNYFINAVARPKAPKEEVKVHLNRSRLEANH